MSRPLKYLLLFAFVALAFYVIVESSDNAEAASCTWKQTGGASASTPANWENGSAPVAGDSVYFTSLSTASCTWDITATFNYFGIYSGYTGTITQSADFGISGRGWYLGAGTWVSGSARTITCNGSILHTATAFTFPSFGKLTMTGAGTSITGTGNGPHFNTLTCSESITIYGVVYVDNLVIASGKTLTIDPSADFRLYVNSSTGGATISNSGVIAGGTFRVHVVNTAASLNFGSVTAAVIVMHDPSFGTDQTITLTGDVTGPPSFTVGTTASKIVTLNLGGKTISTINFAVITSGVVLGSGAIVCSGNFNSYNSTTSGSWSLTMTGTSPYIKTAAGNTISGLTWTATNLRLASSLNVTKTFYVGGTYTLGSHSISVKNGCNVTVINGNSWTLMGQTRYWNRVIIAGTLTCAVPVSIWCNGTVYFNGTVNNNIVLHCNGWVNSMGGYVGNIWIETAYRNYIYYNGTFVRLNWNLTTPWILVEGFTPNPGDAYSKAGTMSIVTSIGHWMNISSLAGSPFIIDLVTWSILEGSYNWHIMNLGAATVFTFSLYLAVDEVDMSVYRNNVFMEVLSVEEGGYLSFYDTIAPNVETSYLLVPGSANASAIDWYLIGFCLAILALLSYMGLKNENFMIIAGLGWIAVSVLEFQPIQNTVALIALGVGIIFAVWGAYKYAYG